MSGLNRYHYFVEGQCEQKLINVLKDQKNLIIAGKVDVLNVMQEEITDLKLRTLPYKVTIILVFDTDKANLEILNRNLHKLRAFSQVKEVWCVKQVPNLEGELERSTNLKDIKQLFGCDGINEFKEKFIKEKNLYKKLMEIGFVLEKMWICSDRGKCASIKNEGYKIIKHTKR